MGLVLGDNSLQVASNNSLRLSSTVTTFIFGYAALSQRAAQPDTLLNHPIVTYPPQASPKLLTYMYSQRLTTHPFPWLHSFRSQRGVGVCEAVGSRPFLRPSGTCQGKLRE